MARKTHVILIDDMDGSEAAETVKFGLDGVSYEIDLSEENAQQLREQMDAWVRSGRRVGGRKTAGTRSASTGETARIRSWAKDQGLDVSERGRVSQEIRDAYEAAHG